nr:hypothetical protein [Herbaspirillum sp. ASV7]
MSIKKLKLLVASLFIWCTSAAAEPTFIYNSGGNWKKIVEVDNIVVAGFDYDVIFKAWGTCNDLFSQCDASQFAFKTESAAAAANQALFDQALNSLAAFNSWDWIFDPRSGCNYYSASGPYGCNSWSVDSTIYTPYSTSIGIDTVNTSSLTLFMYGDLVNGQQPGPNYRSGWIGESTLPDSFGPGTFQSYYAIWIPRPDIQVLPEPGAFPLIAIGLLSLVLAGNRRKLKWLG